jgi:hypothetical protein
MPPGDLRSDPSTQTISGSNKFVCVDKQWHAHFLHSSLCLFQLLLNLKDTCEINLAQKQQLKCSSYLHDAAYL